MPIPPSSPSMPFVGDNLNLVEMQKNKVARKYVFAQENQKKYKKNLTPEVPKRIRTNDSSRIS